MRKRTQQHQEQHQDGNKGATPIPTVEVGDGNCRHRIRPRLTRYLEELAIGVEAYGDDIRTWVESLCAERSALVRTVLARVITNSCIEPERLTPVVCMLPQDEAIYLLQRQILEEEPDVLELAKIKTWAGNVLTLLLKGREDESKSHKSAVPPPPPQSMNIRPFHKQIKRTVLCAEKWMRMGGSNTCQHIEDEFELSLSPFDFQLYPRELEVVLSFLVWKYRPHHLLGKIDGAHYERMEGMQLGMPDLLFTALFEETPQQREALDEMRERVGKYEGWKECAPGTPAGSPPPPPPVDTDGILAEFSAGSIHLLVYDLLNLCIYVPEDNVCACFVALRTVLHSREVQESQMAPGYFCTKISQLILAFLCGGDVHSALRLLLALLVSDTAHSSDHFEDAWRARRAECHEIARALERLVASSTDANGKMARVMSSFKSQYCTLNIH